MLNKNENERIGMVAFPKTFPHPIVYIIKDFNSEYYLDFLKACVLHVVDKIVRIHRRDEGGPVSWLQIIKDGVVIEEVKEDICKVFYDHFDEENEEASQKTHKYYVTYRDEFSAVVEASSEEEAIEKFSNGECEIKVFGELWPEFFEVTG